MRSIGVSSHGNVGVAYWIGSRVDVTWYINRTAPFVRLRLPFGRLYVAEVMARAAGMTQ